MDGDDLKDILKRHKERIKNHRIYQNYHTYRQKIPRWLQIIIIIIVVLVVLKLLIMFFEFLFGTKKTQTPAVPVIAAEVQEQDFPVYITALGSVIPVDTVTVKTQINGQLLKVLYSEGQYVQAGELLAEIDPRPYEAQLLQLQGQLLRDQALLENARIDLARYEQLMKQDSVAEQTLATQQALVKQYEGTVQIDLGQIAAMQLNIIYTRITSPINGRVGLRLVDPGNFVQTSDTTGMFVLNTMQPITVVFPIPEDNLGQVVEKVNEGNILETKAYDRTQNTLLSLGQLIAYDNQIDPTTGTIRLRAQFENKDYELFPNQFVNVKLKVDTIRNANVIPLAAIQRGIEGSFVYLITPHNTVEVLPVKVEATEGDSVAITGEIAPGHFVVVQGAEKLKNHSKINILNKNINKNNSEQKQKNNLKKQMHALTTVAQSDKDICRGDYRSLIKQYPLKENR